MRRRALLASLVAGTAGIAGCSFQSDDGSDPSGNDGTPTGDHTTRTATDELTPTPTETDRTGTDTDRTETPTEGSEWFDPPEDRASIVELDTVGRTYAFAPTTLRTHDEAAVVLGFDRTATADHPARLRGYLENANDFENTFRIEWIPAVGRRHSRQPRGYDHEGRLHMVPTENNELADHAPSISRNDEGLWVVDDTGPSMPETYRMDPGERVRLEYVLVGEPGTPGRPTGTYEFRGDEERARVAVWETDSPGPTGDSRFAGDSVPALDDSTQWYHEADAGTEVFVRPSTERVELDGAVAFEAVNHAHQSVSCGHWNLHKLVEGEWFHVGPSAHTADCRSLSPGEQKRWTLRAFNGDAVGYGGRRCGCDGLTRGHLGGGRYAVVAGYGHPDDGSAALVDLVGDPVPVTFTDDVGVERDGATVTITTPEYGDDEHPPDGTFSLERTDSAEERLIAEQLMGTDTFAGPAGSGLRNAIAAMDDDVDRVVVRTDQYDVDNAIGHDADRRRIRFRGQAYLVTRTTGDEG